MNSPQERTAECTCITFKHCLLNHKGTSPFCTALSLFTLNRSRRQLQICKASFALKPDVFYTVIYSLYYCRVILQKLAAIICLKKNPRLRWCFTGILTC
jgi:hypothetical protein